MFRFINKIRRSGYLKEALGNCDGQVAIVLILVIAAALIFYAVSLNLGDFALSQAIVTVASNTSASMLASDMASYGQALSSSSLGGDKKICAWTGILAAIITIIIIVIVIVISIYCPPAGGFMAKGGALLIAGLVLAVASLIIQIVVIQPGITDAWNRIISKTLSMTNQFTENAIQSALSKAVTDTTELPDINDVDGDRIWVDPAAADTPPFADEVSRYSLYYTERLRQIKDQVALQEIADFINALQEFLYEGADGWGIHDPAAGACVGKAECDPCCAPYNATVGSTSLSGLRTEDCPNFDQDAYWDPICSAASPYQSPPGNISYPWLYDAYYENPDNLFFSFRELIGLDDEHQEYYKDWNDPNSDPAALAGPGRNSQFFHVNASSPWADGVTTGATATGFRLEDATGFYVPPFYPMGVENRVGIYPFFYKMRDWGVDLANVETDIANDPGTTLTDTESRECHWCDIRDMILPLGTDNCRACLGYPPHIHPFEIPQLILPLDPADPNSGVVYNTTYFVDWANNPIDVGRALPQPYPPLAVDKITLPLPGDIIAEDADPTTASNVCAQDSLYPQPPTRDGFWRAGGDRFCDIDAAYFLDCPKCGGSASCSCNSSNVSNFPDDVIDDLVYGLPEFIEWAQRLLAQGTNIKKLTSDFPNWYPEAAAWIEPLSPPASNSSNPPCYVCNLTLPDGTPIPEGILYIWLKEMTEIRDRIVNWINNYNRVTGIYDGYGGITCTEVWCVPDASLTCQEVPFDEGEEATFDANANLVQGDIEDIVSCLNYNVNGYDHVAAEAFKTCRDSCSIANCTVGMSGTLPAFHLDGITPYEYPQTFTKQTLSCSDPDGTAPWTCPHPSCWDCSDTSTETYEGYSIIPTTLNCSGWVQGNPWYDAIIENIAAASNPPTMKKGNDYRFKDCATTCSLAACHRLPRTLVPFARDKLYWPQNYQPFASLNFDPLNADAVWKDLTAFNNCLNNCNAENCLVGPRLPIVQSSDGITPYTYPLAGIPLDCINNWGVYGAGNAWYDAIVDNKTLIKPMDEVDMEPMLRCYDDCVNNIADCQTMPVTQTSTGGAYTWSAGAPAGFGPGSCDAATGRPLPPWDADIAANVLLAGGPSCDLSNDPSPIIPDGWLYSTRQSYIEAINQVAKFEKRRDFLKRDVDVNADGVVDYTVGRLAEAQNILEILDGTNEYDDAGDEIDPGAIDKFTDFLLGPAADLIRARINYKPYSGDTGLPYQAIYGWKDEDELLATGGTVPGRWHIVKVEARTPGACDNLCGGTTVPTIVNGTPGALHVPSLDPGWPRIITYTRKWGTERCYELVNTEGFVKFRTTRWDEDRSTKPCANLNPCPSECGSCGSASLQTYRPMMKFPNGMPLWTFRGNNPRRPVDYTKYNPDSIEGVCGPIMLTGPSSAPNLYDGAFIMNKYEALVNANCWNLANGLLSSGYVNETCAQYYWHEGINKGMGLRFVKCSAF